MPESLRSGDEFFHPFAQEVAQRIQKLLFTSRDQEDLDLLSNPAVPVVDFLAESTQLLESDLIVRLVNDHPDNTGILPSTFKLPAFHIVKLPPLNPLSLTNAQALTKFGTLSFLTFDVNNKTFYVKNEYYLNLEGQAIRLERIEIFSELQSLNPEERKNFLEVMRGIGAKQVDFAITENDSRLVPASGSDLEYIMNLLDQYEAGNFEDGTLEKEDAEKEDI